MTKLRYSWLLGLVLCFTASLRAASVTLAVSPTPSLFGEPTTLTATVTPSSATGKVTFYDGATVLGTATMSGGVATLVVEFNANVARVLYARYLGDGQNASAVSPQSTYSVHTTPSFSVAPTTVNPQIAPYNLAVGDFTGDEKTDIVVVGAPSTIKVLPGIGDGTFGSAITTTLAETSYTNVAAADFDGDGNLDIVTTNSANHMFVVFGVGDGTFTGAVQVSNSANGLPTVSDFNADGLPDIAVPTAGFVYTILGTGSRTFAAPVSHTTITGITAVLAGDINSDGKIDLFSVIPSGNPSIRWLTELLGNGDGTFQSTFSYTVTLGTNDGTEIERMLTGDMNEDGKLDIIVAGQNVAVVTGIGDTNFNNPSFGQISTANLGYSRGLAVVDVNGDNHLDVVVERILSGDNTKHQIHIFLGNGDGTLQAPSIQTFSSADHQYLAPADFNGDHRVDLATVNQAAGHTDQSPGLIRLYTGTVSPLLRASLTHGGTFTEGQAGAFTLTVSNLAGASVTGGTITVQPSISGSMTVTSMNGTGWTCNSSQCTRSDALAAGASYPSITINVTVGSNLQSYSFTPVVVVSGGGSPDTQASETVNITPASCAYALDQYSALVNKSGAQKTIQVTTSGACSWTPASHAAWIQIDPASQGTFMGNGSVVIVIALNTTGVDRTSTLTIADKVYTVQQTGFNTLTLNAQPRAVFRDTFGAIGLASYPSVTLSNGGGVFASDPSAAKQTDGNLFVTARDGSNGIWATSYDVTNQAWGTWKFGGGVTQGVPSIAVTPSGTAWIAARDNYNAYWLVSFNGTTYGTWTPLSGVFSTDPAITACGDGSLYLVGKDNYNALWSAHYIPGIGLQGFVLGGGVVQGKPSITCGNDNAVYIAVRDNYNSNWVARVSGNTWTGWYNGGAVTSIDPRIASLGGSVAVLILDNGGATYRASFTNGVGNNWSSWASIGGVLADIAPAGVGSELYFIGKAPNSVLWWYSLPDNQWTRIGASGVVAGQLATAPR